MKINHSGIALGLLILVGCGGSSGKQLTQNVSLVQSQAKKIQETKGDAKGTDLTGTWDIAYSDQKVTCSKKVKGIELGKSATVICTQTDGSFSCHDEDEKADGYIKVDGSFSLVNTVTASDANGHISGVIIIAGNISVKDGGAAKGNGYIEGKDDKNKTVRCTASSSMKMTKKAPAATDVPSSSSQSLDLDVATSGSYSKRHFTDVQARETDQGTEVVANGTGNEKVHGLINEDGSASLHIALAGATGINQPSVISENDCTGSTTENEDGTRQIKFVCPAIHATARIAN